MVTKESDANTTIFCFGFGYVCQHLARIMRGKDAQIPNRITGTVSSSKSQQIILDSQGLHTIIWQQGDDFSSEMLSALATSSHIIYSIPPNKDFETVQNDIRKTVAALKNLPNIKSIYYLSSTAVYGNHFGAWVDESTPCTPTSLAGKTRLIAENAWIESATPNSLPIWILRLSGIYGMGRNAVEDIIGGGVSFRLEMPDSHTGVFSRIHVADICGVLLHLLEIVPTIKPQIINLADDLPATRSAVLDYAFDLLAILESERPPRLPYITASAQGLISAKMQAFYQDSKKIKNERLSNEIGYRLQYPSYKEGLQNFIKTVGENAL